MNSSTWVGGLTVRHRGVDCTEFWIGRSREREGEVEGCVTWNGGGRGPALAQCHSLSPSTSDPGGFLTPPAAAKGYTRINTFEGGLVSVNQRSWPQGSDSGPNSQVDSHQGKMWWEWPLREQYFSRQNSNYWRLSFFFFLSSSVIPIYGAPRREKNICRK